MSHHHDAASPHSVEAWQVRAAQYDRMSEVIEPEMRRATEAMLDAVGAGPRTRLLDLACGPGHTTAAAQARGSDVLGVDVTPGMIEAARRRFPACRFAVGDMLDPPPGPWDAVTCRLGAHHVDDAWAKAVWRVLVPGGRLAVAEWAPTDEASRAKGMRAPETWVRLLESAGFEAITIATEVLLLGTMAARDPRLADPLARGSHLRDGLIYIISGKKSACAR